jgi:hypothetical protein
MTGCGALQSATGWGSSLNGEYRGFLDVEDELMAFSLDLLQSGSSLSGRLESEDGLVARGRGTLTHTDMHLELQYETTCPGVIVLRGRASNGGDRLLGEFRAEDCTGRTTGAFDLRR